MDFGKINIDKRKFRISKVPTDISDVDNKWILAKSKHLLEK